MIDRFHDEHRWLSNFHPASIKVGDIVFPTVEHAYIAAKSEIPFSPIDLEWFIGLSAGKVKRVGRKLDLRADWDKIKLSVMLDLTKIKYSEANPELRDLLIATGDQEIIEGNHWNDTFWGVCDGVGRNWLGQIIMGVRNEIVVDK
tara:strand:- start:144 stop:578 length:435 start_codon:yes stop_codon:yes gene_type:complete